MDMGTHLRVAFSGDMDRNEVEIDLTKIHGFASRKVRT